MKNFRLLAALILTGSLIFTFSLSDADAQGKRGKGIGQRQMLRDGSGAGSQKGFQAKKGIGQVKGRGDGTGTCPMNKAGSSRGDGT